MSSKQNSKPISFKFSFRYKLIQKFNYKEWDEALNIEWNVIKNSILFRKIERREFTLLGSSKMGWNLQNQPVFKNLSFSFILCLINYCASYLIVNYSRFICFLNPSDTVPVKWNKRFILYLALGINGEKNFILKEESRHLLLY